MAGSEEMAAISPSLSSRTEVQSETPISEGQSAFPRSVAPGPRASSGRPLRRMGLNGRAASLNGRQRVGDGLRWYRAASDTKHGDRIPMLPLQMPVHHDERQLLPELRTRDAPVPAQ